VYCHMASETLAEPVQYFDVAIFTSEVACANDSRRYFPAYINGSHAYAHCRFPFYHELFSNPDAVAIVREIALTPFYKYLICKYSTGVSFSYLTKFDIKPVKVELNIFLPQYKGLLLCATIVFGTELFQGMKTVLLCLIAALQSTK